MVLRGRGDGVLELRVNGVFVMDTEHVASEEALAAAALERCSSPERVLVGGLGLGSTARRVLADPRVVQVVVVEIEEVLVGWLRDGVVPHGPALLADDRVEVVVGDVAEVLARAQPEHDVVLLDVDNGPSQLVLDGNAGLYSPALLRAAAGSLRPGGVLAIWSATREPGLLRDLAASVGRAEEHVVGVRLQDRDEEHAIYLATVTP